MLNIGRLNHKVTILRRTPEEDELGQEHLAVFTPYKTVWATVAPLRGRDFWDARRVREDDTYKITIRQPADHSWTITGDMRIKYKNRIFEIISPIDPDMRGEYWEINAVEHVNTHEE